jgi:hypothetical protein
MRKVLRYYGYMAILAGTMSVLFSAAWLITAARLPFQFGTVRGNVNLTVGDAWFNTALWVLALLVFLIYPVFFAAARSSRIILATHGMAFVVLISMLAWSGASFVLVVLNIITFLLAFRDPMRILGLSRLRATATSLVAMFGSIILVELLAFSAWLSDPSSVLRGFSGHTGALGAAARLDLGFYYAAFLLVPWLILLVMVSPLATETAGRLIRRRLPASSQLVAPSRLRLALFFLGIFAVSVLAGVIAYLPYSFSQYPVGIDAHWYSDKLEALAKGASPIELIFKETRAVYLMLLYGIQLATQLPTRDVIMWGAILLSVLLVLGTFFVMKESEQPYWVCLLAACFASLSPQILVGTLASIFSNWLALAEMLLFFGFLLRAERTSNRRDAVASFLLSAAVLATHPWTWVILVGVLVIYVILSASHARSRNFFVRSKGLKILTGSLILGTIAFAVSSQLGMWQEVVNLGVSWALLQNLALARAPMGFLRDLQIALYNYSTQGMFSNWIMIVLAVAGVFSLARLETRSRIIVESWILGGLVPFLFLGWEIQWRLLFLMPYQILAAMGLFVLTDSVASRVMSRMFSEGDIRLVRAIQITFVTSILLLFLNNAARAMVYTSTQIVP